MIFNSLKSSSVSSDFLTFQKGKGTVLQFHQDAVQNPHHGGDIQQHKNDRLQKSKGSVGVGSGIRSHTKSCPSFCLYIFSFHWLVIVMEGRCQSLLLLAVIGMISF